MVTPKLYQPFIHYLPWLCVPKSTEWTDCLKEGVYSKCTQGWVLEFHFRRWKEAEKSSKGDEEEAGDVGRKYFKPSDRFYQYCWESKTRQNYHWTWQNCCYWQHWLIPTACSGRMPGVDWKGRRWGSKGHGPRRSFHEFCSRRERRSGAAARGGVSETRFLKMGNKERSINHFWWPAGCVHLSSDGPSIPVMAPQFSLSRISLSLALTTLLLWS